MASRIWDQASNKLNAFLRADATLSDEAHICPGDIHRPDPSVTTRSDGAFQRAARFFRVERGAHGYYLDEIRIITCPSNGPAIHGGTHALTLEYIGPSERLPRDPARLPDYVVDADGRVNLFAAVPVIFESLLGSETDA